MATVTGLTAERMQEIIDSTIVSAEVVGDHIILHKHDGSTVDAGAIPGPGADTIIGPLSILDVGIPNQIRAGRQLTLQDFTNIGLQAPAAIWNMGTMNDVSGAGRGLTLLGAGPTQIDGINGVANTAYKFPGMNGVGLYTPDSGAADPLRIRTGSIGCWFKTAKRGTTQALISKWGTAAQFVYMLEVNSVNNTVAFTVSPSGGGGTTFFGISDVADDRWHHVVATIDGSFARIYVDGALEISGLVGPAFSGSSPTNIGSYSVAAPGGTAQNPHFGRIDEVFVTQDVLSDDQVRNLYASSVANALSSIPKRVHIFVHRRKRGSALVVADFPAQPLRLHNFSAGSLSDLGSIGSALINNGTAFPLAGADGSPSNSMGFAGAQSLSQTDAGLPSGTGIRSYGCWFKTSTIAAQGIMGWGTKDTNDAQMRIGVNGDLSVQSGPDQMTRAFAADGQWHFVVCVEENAPVDGIKRRLYFDGRLVASSTVLTSLTLAGANRYRIGAFSDGTQLFNGQIDGAFVCGYAMTMEQILSLYYKGSQSLGASPKNAGDHVELARADDLLCIFDSIDSQHQVELAVAA